MSNWLSRRERTALIPAERDTSGSPIPTRVVSNGEFNPIPQTAKQRAVERRIADLGDRHGRALGLDRRSFLKTLPGMAAAFLAMNEVHGEVFEIASDEARDPAAAGERAAAYAGQRIFDDQTHFNRDDLAHPEPIEVGKFAAKHWNPGMLDEMGIVHERFQLENFLKEVYLDSETQVALLSTVPFEDRPWLLSNDQMARTRELVNGIAGARRMLTHAAFTPGIDGWQDDVDEAIERFRPDSWKGYTIGDPLDPTNSKHPWRMDDEALVYPFYEKIRKAGITTVCVHKGLVPRDYANSMEGVWRHASVEDVGKAAKDWPDLQFVIYHSALRPFVELPDQDAQEFERTGYIRWVSDLARIPAQFGVSNVYGEIGTSFANTVVTHPRLAAGMLGTLVAGLGADHVLWGTDSTWYGSPQWQIEAFRRLEIPEDLRARHGFEPLGPGEGALKNGIFWGNGARLYGLDDDATSRSLDVDAIESMRADYRDSGLQPSNLRYGYIHA